MMSIAMMPIAMMSTTVPTMMATVVIVHLVKHSHSTVMTAMSMMTATMGCPFIFSSSTLDGTGVGVSVGLAVGLGVGVSVGLAVGVGVGVPIP